MMKVAHKTFSHKVTQLITVCLTVLFDDKVSLRRWHQQPIRKTKNRKTIATRVLMIKFKGAPTAVKNRET